MHLQMMRSPSQWPASPRLSMVFGRSWIDARSLMVSREARARQGDRRLVRPRAGLDVSPARGSRPERLRPRTLRADRIGGRPDHSRRQVAAESLPGARPPRGNNDGESPDGNPGRLRPKARSPVIKGGHCGRQKYAESSAPGFSVLLEVPPEFQDQFRNCPRFPIARRLRPQKLARSPCWPKMSYCRGTNHSRSDSPMGHRVRP